jgi:hypothetical protein
MAQGVGPEFKPQYHKKKKKKEMQDLKNVLTAVEVIIYSRINNTFK